MAERRPSLLLPIVLVVVVLVAGGVGGGLLYEANHRSPSAPWTVSVGSNVTVNYIGTFASGPQTDRVFDTSIYSVAIANVTYPKAISFTYRGSEANYTPLPVAVGPLIPSSGYTVGNLTFDGVVTGFWQGLLGMTVGQSRLITVPPSLGYGEPDPACFASQPLTFTTPTIVAMTPSAFATAYPGVSATGGTTFTDPTYGWTDLVLSVNSSAVLVQKQATVGWSVPGTAWTVAVTAVNTTTITLRNQLTYGNLGNVSGTVSTPVCGETHYIVSGLNASAGTYIEDFNPQVVGQTLVFQVTIVAKY